MSEPGELQTVDLGAVLAAIADTSEAIERSRNLNSAAQAPLENPRQAVQFTRGLFEDLGDAIGPDAQVEGLILRAVQDIEVSLRLIRVAAIAFNNSAANVATVEAQAADGTTRLESALGVLLSRFRSLAEEGAGTPRAARINPILNKYGEQLEARQLVAEVRETRDEAQRALTDTRRAAGAVGESSLAQHFGEYAAAERFQANALRVLCVATLLSIVAVAVVLLGNKEASRLTTTHELARLAITIPLAVLATYLGGEAARHRRVARRAREMEIQLQTVDAFTQPLPDSLRDSLRTELGRQVFAAPVISDEEGSPNGPSVINDAGSLLEKVAELLRAAAANRPG